VIATITKDFAFSASHRLLGLPRGHQCGRTHGHNYVVRVEIEGVVDDVGFVFDYGKLKPFGDWIDENLDHRDLNTALENGDNPTAEHLAGALLQTLRTILRGQINGSPHPLQLAVSVSETPKTWATYREKW
jgi:6-pyruvoyltetrahydropterin/6-carboxytetrahydropterin synthase